jgi:hypothetical protein
MAAVSAALAIGETGSEGRLVGLVFSALALATFARIAALAGGLQKLPEYAPLLQGTGGVLVGRRCRFAGDRSIPGVAEVGSGERELLILRSRQSLRLEGWPRASWLAWRCEGSSRDGASAPPHHEAEPSCSSPGG